MIKNQNRNNIGNQNFINEKASFKIDILYALISIYYYEKTLSLNNKKEPVFNESKAYYFINPKWIVDFKKVYKYQILSQLLKSLKLEDISISYYNFESNLPLIKDYLSQNDFNLVNDKIPNNLMVNIFSKPNIYNNSFYYPFCYIIDIRIKNIILKYVFPGNKLNIKGKKVFAKNNSVYLNIANNIMIGNLDRNFIFIAEYALFFSSSEFLLNEKNFLLNNSFSDYLKYKQIEKISSNLLPLKDENNNIIGQIMKLSKAQETNKNNAAKSAPKKKFLENKLKEKVNKTTYTVISNNSKRKIPVNINKPIFKKINTSKGLVRTISPQGNEILRKNNINQSQSNRQEDNKSSNNLSQYRGIKEFALNNKKSKLVNKDNNSTNKDEVEEELNKKKYFSINPLQNKKVGNQLKNDNKIKKDFDLNQQYEERDFQNLLKEKNELQNQINNIKNFYANKLKDLENVLEIKNNENDDLKKKISNLEEILNRKEKEKFNLNQSEFKNKEKELNKREEEINEREKNLIEKEYLISKKIENNNRFDLYLNEKEDFKDEHENSRSNIQKENELNKREDELNERQNILDKRALIVSKKEEEINNKEKELEKKEKELRDLNKQILEKENNLNKREIEILRKEKELKENKNLSQNNNNIVTKDNIKMPIPPPEPSPISFYKKPTLIGLNNIGATCFMNSTLQCLSQTPDLTNYFLKDSKQGRIINNNLAKENKNSLQLSPIYLKLIKKLWDKKSTKSFSPNEFMNTIEKMNPLFKKGQAGDSKDFIIYILEQIHKELKSNINMNYNVDQPLNQYDRNNALNFFLKDFSKDCSIISDAFFGFTETTNECLNCKNYYNSQYLNNPICYNFGIFNCLIFPLEEVKNYKNKNLSQSFYNMNNSMNNMSNMSNMSYMNNMNYMNNVNNMNNMSFMSNISQNNSVTLEDCFLYNQKTDLFTGENKNYCNICKQLYDSYYTSKIYSCPNNLILILNRGKNNIYNIKLYFTETIDITKYVVINDGNRWIYNLYGVITHIGESGPNAHFVASCKSPVDNKWYRYNDAFVNPINDVQKEIINFGTPYILFYQKAK